MLPLGFLPCCIAIHITLFVCVCVYLQLCWLSHSSYFNASPATVSQVAGYHRWLALPLVACRWQPNKALATAVAPLTFLRLVIAAAAPTQLTPWLFFVSYPSHTSHSLLAATAFATLVTYRADISGVTVFTATSQHTLYFSGSLFYGFSPALRSFFSVFCLELLSVYL